MPKFSTETKARAVIVALGVMYTTCGIGSIIAGARVTQIGYQLLRFGITQKD